MISSIVQGAHYLVLVLFRKLKKLWRFIFGINDWYTVWERTVDTECYRSEELWSDEIEWFWETCKYRIVFSPTRNRYRLKCSGFHYKEISTYKEAVETLNHFIKQLG